MLVGDLGEDALLRELREIFAATAPGVPVGIGDDAAVIEQVRGEQFVWTTDLLLEGIHFERAWQTAWQLGRKCLAVNLSDLASMAATPKFALLSIACSPETSADFIIEFCEGFASMASEYNVSVIGGDTTGSAGGLALSVTAGGTVESGRAVLRSGALAGDAILVTGSLGDASGGLRILGERLERHDDFRYLVDRLLEPQPRFAAAAAALKAGVTAMTDVSDGLASDLRHICEESGVGAALDPGSLPISRPLEAAAAEFGWDLESLVLSGGEDYELLFTLPGDLAGQLSDVIARAADVPVTVIGEVMPAGYGVQLVASDGSGRDLPPRGYDHFLDSER